MKRLFVTGMLALSLSLVVHSVHAAGYGYAGCGLGAVLFGDTPGGAQISASTTNGTSHNQAFGISSGTLNCDATTGIIIAEREDEVFFAMNMSSLEKETAVGSGENLDTLAGLLGCPVGSHEAFGEAVQENYDSIFKSGNSDPEQMLKAVKTTIGNDTMLKAACSM